MTKCVCGYEYREEYNNHLKTVIEGNEEFIETELCVYYEDTSEIYRSETVKRYVIICPKCSNLMIDGEI